MKYKILSQNRVHVPLKDNKEAGVVYLILVGGCFKKV